MLPSPQPAFASPPHCGRVRLYRLLDGHGRPHPELDDLFECLDLDHESALDWLERCGLLQPQAPACERQAMLCLHFGIEVSTPSGDWRTLRHPGPGLATGPGLCDTGNQFS